MVQIDIQMPSDCYSCWVRKNMGCKIANDSGWLNNKRDDNCPLKEQETKQAIKQIYHVIRIQAGIEKRGGYVDPKWLLDVLTGHNENGGAKNDAV